MPDFEALNELRSQTLRQIREMVSEHAALWDRPFDGQNTSAMLAGIEQDRVRFQALWSRHEAVRLQMVDAGVMPPPVEPDGLSGSLGEDPGKRQIEERLRGEMEAARADYYRINGEFRVFVAHGAELPVPDGNLRARQVAAAHSAALRKYTSSLRRFSAFLVSGDPGDE
jgi:hypothetical protein